MLDCLRGRTAKLVAGAATAVLLAGVANAQNNYTEAGTEVENTFQLEYSVGGTTQPTITNDDDPLLAGDPNFDVQGTPTDVIVDRLLDVVVAYEANVDDDDVAPGAQDEVMVFTVTNESNDDVKFDLAVTQEGATDDFDPANVTIEYFIDLDGDGVQDPGEPTETYTSAADMADIAPDQSIVVSVIADIPVGEADDNTGDLILTADIREPDDWLVDTTGTTPGAEVFDDGDAGNGGNSTNDAGVDNILADDAGEIDNANEGDSSDRGTFTVASPDLAATKDVAILATYPVGNPTGAAGSFDCTSLTAAGPTTPVSAEEYAVPGACVEYVITVTNNSADTIADIDDLSDLIPDGLTFLDARFDGFTGGTEAEPAANTACDGTATCTVQITNADLAAASTATITIRALID